MVSMKGDGKNSSSRKFEDYLEDEPDAKENTSLLGQSANSNVF
jgi:hypothetical protein